MRGRKHVDLPQIEYPVAARQEDLDVACAANAREQIDPMAITVRPTVTSTARTLSTHARRTLKPNLKAKVGQNLPIRVKSDFTVAKAFRVVGVTASICIMDLDPRDVKVGAKVDAKVRVGLRGVRSMAKVIEDGHH